MMARTGRMPNSHESDDLISVVAFRLPYLELHIVIAA